jgi:hypothetical protein
MAEKQKGFSFGGATFSRTSPPVEKLTGETKILNVVLPFEEALKLSVAMQACIMWLNEKNRATKEGKAAALNVAVHVDKGRIVVTRGMKVTEKAKTVKIAVA